MEWIDVTVPLRTGMTVFEGDPAVSIQRVLSLVDGAICNLSRMDFGLHSGTHIDAPLHFIDGAPGIEATPLDALIGPAYVADARHVTGHIDEKVLDSLAIPEGTARVIFATSNSRLWERDSFVSGFVGIKEDAAQALVARGVRLVGIDYLSVAPFGDPAPTHVALLEAGVVILEGLDLRRVEPGEYTLVSLPMLIPGSDGAPARTLLGR